MSSTTPHAPGADAPLGIPGYTFADLHDPDRLASLYEQFCERVQTDDPALWTEWDAYRRSPDAERPPIALSNLLTTMAPHVSRFVTRLFDVDGSARAIVAATHAQDDLFRFKVDFVRRRVLPFVKSSTHPPAQDSRDDATVDKLAAEHGTAAGDDRELAIARAGCALLD